MANRVIAEDVIKILDTNLADTNVENYITVANLMVDPNLIGKGLSDVVLTEIEKWVSAHLIKSTKERQPQEIEIGDAREKYGSFGKYGSIGEGLATTSYGQIATLLDTSGTLENMSKEKASMSCIPEFDDSELL